jgi:cysteine desulfurase/selenocysteine lyase
MREREVASHTSQAGSARIEVQLLSLRDLLLEALQRKGYRIYSAHANRYERSGIISFVSPQHPAEVLKQRLQERGMVVTTRSGWLRVAPHFYNTQDNSNRLLAALP